MNRQKSSESLQGELRGLRFAVLTLLIATLLPLPARAAGPVPLGAGRFGQDTVFSGHVASTLTVVRQSGLVRPIVLSVQAEPGLECQAKGEVKLDAAGERFLLSGPLGLECHTPDGWKRWPVAAALSTPDDGVAGLPVHPVDSGTVQLLRGAGVLIRLEQEVEVAL